MLSIVIVPLTDIESAMLNALNIGADDGRWIVNGTEKGKTMTDRERFVEILGNSGCAADLETLEQLADCLVSNGAMTECPHCRRHFDVIPGEDFAICPYCERDVEVKSQEDDCELAYRNGKETMRSAIIDLLRTQKGIEMGTRRALLSDLIDMIRKLDVRPWCLPGYVRPEGGSMSKPRYKWWGYIKAVIRAYPALKKDYEDLHEQFVTSAISGMPGGGGASRGTENIAIRELPDTLQREYEAVRSAIDATAMMATGKDRLALVDMVFWKCRHNLTGAAHRLNISTSTAQRYHGEFIRLVATAYGLMDRRDGSSQ